MGQHHGEEDLDHLAELELEPEDRDPALDATDAAADRQREHQQGDAEAIDRPREGAQPVVVGSGGGDEDDLEEKVRGAGVNRATVEAILGRCRKDLVQVERFDAGEEIAAAIHDGVAAGEIHETGYGVQRHILGQDLGGVLGADETGLEHRETA